MKGNTIKGLISAVAATAFASLWAAPVSCDQARTAVGNWLRRDAGLGCRLGTAVASARTCTTTNGASFHVVKLTGGGFVVTSADTTQEPVVAFSDSDDLVESADNPLWGILQADFSRRTRATNAVSRSRAARALTATERRWDKLLSDAPTARSGNGLASVSDLRVDEIIKSKWGQTMSSAWVDGDGVSYGWYCYNYFTPPDGEYPCGCVATCMSQIMRHHRYPDSANIVVSKCSVDGVATYYRTSGAQYDWDNMPLIPEEFSGAPWYAGGMLQDDDDTQYRAIGQLTVDCGVAVHMSWNPSESSSRGAFSFEAWTNVFKYANARAYIMRSETSGMDMSTLRQIMLPNLDAGYPVMLGIKEHEVIADGYGFSDNVLYTHLNMGWDGIGNAWYNLPSIVAEYGEDEHGDPVYYSSSFVNHVTYNIFPNGTGELLSGRVIDSDGNPIGNARVSVSLVSSGTTSGGSTTSGGGLLATNTNDRGIYAFRLIGGRTYNVTASFGTLSQTKRDIWLPQSVNPTRVNWDNGDFTVTGMACGNRQVDDIELTVSSVATPVFGPPSCVFYPATNVFISCATEGATIHYTLDGSVPDETSPIYPTMGIYVAGHTTTVRARAYFSGMNPSMIAEVTYIYDIAQDYPLGDYYSRPIPISGTEGSRVTGNSSYTLEDGEPWHTLDESTYTYKPQYHSIWHSWTAPGSGDVTFTTRASDSNWLYPTLVAVYVGETMATAVRLGFSEDYLSSGNYSTSFSFRAEEGVTYHIVGAVMSELYDPSGVPFTLSWTSNIVPPTPELRTLYVNAALPANATQDGLSATTAFHDLPAAMAILQDGDTVLVAPGTYSPAVVGASNVTVRATGAVAATIIDGGGKAPCCSVDLESDSATATFEGFTLVNGGGADMADEDIGTYCYGGGALFVTLTRCVISNCVAEIGGGAYGCDLRNCLLAGNVADFYAGGASECSLVGCTVYGNAAEEYCGGIASDCVATNCIVWGNAVGDGSSPDFEDSDYGLAQLAYSCSSSLADGAGNLAADPKFRNAAAGDFRLRPNSPCLDVGTMADISSTETDLAGGVRIQDGAPDIGAYEGKFPIDAIRLLSPDLLLYGATSQIGFAVFECDNAWQVSCPANWITFRAQAGSGDVTLDFSIGANTDGVSRTANVTVVDSANNVITFQVRQAAAAIPPTADNRYFGLFVGVNEYDALALRNQGYAVTPLSGSVPDATNVCARFTDWGFCRREDAIVLTDRQATVSAIRTAFTNIAAQAVAGDTVLYYHSGHGYLDRNTTVALVGYEGFYWDYDLAADLGLFADGVRVVVMADTCNSGGLFKGAGTRGRASFNLAERVHAIMSKNRIRRSGGLTRGSDGTATSTGSTTFVAPSQIGWITAADYDQSAWDRPDGMGGAFTSACLEGWASGAADYDGDGFVSFYELWKYARYAGSEYAADNGEKTEAQCLNEDVLMSVLAGVTDTTVKNMAFAQVDIDCSTVAYRGMAYEPNVLSARWGGHLLVEGTDYTIAYSDNVNVGTATISLTGINHYSGTYSTNFAIVKASNQWIRQPSMADWVYGQTPSVPDMGEAQFGIAYVTYGTSGARPPSEPGEYVATFTVADTANYAGLTQEVPFTISPAGSGVVIPGDGTVAVPKTWKVGQKVTWKATAAKGSVFAHWEGTFVNSLKLSKNELRNPSLAFTVPADIDPAGISAVFLAVDDDCLSLLELSQPAPLTLTPNVAVEGLEVKDDSESYVTASVSGLPTGLKFDAKTLKITGKPTKSGIYWVQVKAKNASGYQWAENIKVTVSGGGKEAKEPKLSRTAYYPLTAICATEGGTVTGTGVYAEGKKASVKATAAKGYVFAGWYRDAALKEPMTLAGGDFRTASQNVIVPEARYLFAKFVTAEEDKKSLMVNIGDAVTEKDGTIGTVGTDGTRALDLGACVESLSLPKLTVSGLPAGLKYDAKTLKITGKATKPGVYAVKVAATNTSVKKTTDETTAIFTITVPNFECAALPRLLPATDAYGTIYAGVTLDASLVDCTPENGWTVKVTGLPTGLKFAAKDTKDAALGLIPAGTVYGVPTAKAGSYTVTFTASKKGEANQVATITLNVETLPVWATGTFDGAVQVRTTDVSSVEGSPCGLVSLTISTAGKISGKLQEGDKTWTLSAAAYDEVESRKVNGESLDGADDELVFIATVVGKSGKEMLTNEVAITAGTVRESVRGVAMSESWIAWQNLWKMDPWKTYAKPFAKVPATTLYVVSDDRRGRVVLNALPAAGSAFGVLSLKFAASGAVTASGKFVTGQDAKGKDIVYSASCSSALIPMSSGMSETGATGDNAFSAILYFPPKAGKFDGYAVVIPFVWDGVAFQLGM